MSASHSRELVFSIPRRRLIIIDTVIIALTVFVLILLLIESTLDLSEQARKMIIITDTIICFIFIAEFIYKIGHCSSKRLYLKRRWIDLLSSIPFIAFLRIGRVFRLIRLFRFLRFGALFSRIGRPLLAYFLEETFHFILFSALSIWILGSAFMYFTEVGVNPNINSIGDAFWWCFVTLTTVGYGDVYPVTTMGKIGSVFTTLIGLGLFSALTALLATHLVEYRGNRK